ncbi:hypothetical protein [Streptosporangium vulgare]|uniref:hypothetical protein n=1 Tax=Streptosporangium vulgare TaxID=46190 RepID=UPI0031E1E25C
MRDPSLSCRASFVTLIAVSGCPLTVVPRSTTLAMFGLAFAAVTIWSRMPPAPLYGLKTPSPLAACLLAAADRWTFRPRPALRSCSAWAAPRIASTVTFLPSADLVNRSSSRSTPDFSSSFSCSAVSSPT